MAKVMYLISNMLGNTRATQYLYYPLRRPHISPDTLASTSCSPSHNLPVRIWLQILKIIQITKQQANVKM